MPDLDKTRMHRLLRRLRYLTNSFKGERRERFYPFLVLLEERVGDPRFDEAVSVGRYFLNNWTTLGVGEELARALEEVLRKYPNRGLAWSEAARRLPLPLADYLKAAYDLERRRKCPSLKSGPARSTG